jgi:hypothetical protein
VVDVALFAGPIGGILAATWGGGAVMGYAFAHKTIGKRVRELRNEMQANEAGCRENIRDLTVRLREIEDRAFYGMERQAAQIRQSSPFIIDHGKIVAQSPEDEGKLP